jgi:hypothetical protein
VRAGAPHRDREYRLVGTRCRGADRRVHRNRIGDRDRSEDGEHRVHLGGGGDRAKHRADKFGLDGGAQVERIRGRYTQAA